MANQNPSPSGTRDQSMQNILDQAHDWVDARDRVFAGSTNPKDQSRFNAHVQRVEGMGPRGHEIWTMAVRWAQDHPRR